MKAKHYLLFLLIHLNWSLIAQKNHEFESQIKKLKNLDFTINEESINNAQKTVKSKEEQYRLNYFKAILYVHNSKYDTAQHLINENLQFYKKQNSFELLGDNYKEIGIIQYYYLNNFLKGKIFLDSSIYFYKKAKVFLPILESQRQIAVIYYYLGDLNKSNNILKEILEEYSPSSSEYLDIQDLLVNNYIANNDYLNAYKVSKNIPNAYLKLKKTRRYAYSLLILGSLQKKQGLIKQAEISLLESYNVSKKNDFRENLRDNTRYLGELYTELFEKGKAEKFLYESLVYAKALKDGYSQMHAISSLGRYYVAMGAFAKGDNLYDESDRVRDSLFTSENNSKLAEYDAKFKTAEKEAKLAEAKLEIAQKRNWIIGLSVAVLAILGLGLMFWRLQKAKQKVDLQNIEIENTRKILNAREIERQRIAKELHDSVGSQLTVVSTSLDNAFFLAENHKLVPQKLEDINADVRDAAQSLRDTIWATHNTVIPISNLYARMQHYLHKVFNENEKITCHATLLGEDRELNSMEALNLFRIFQESVQNIQKHSGASSVNLSLENSQSSLQLTISDDGKGFETNTKNPYENFGLSNMKLRSEEINATLLIKSAKNSGTEIKVLLNYEQNLY